MAEKPLRRGAGITTKFVEAFKNSLLYNELYLKHKDELLLCVRTDYLNIYYNCDNIAEIKYANDDIKVYIHPYYLGMKGKDNVPVSQETIVSEYEHIKARSETHEDSEKEEKKAQQKIVYSNNSSEASKWFCFDVEYRKAHDKKENVEFKGRFDILAISKTAPYHLAIIELKYGFNSITGDSGVTISSLLYVIQSGVKRSEESCPLDATASTKVTKRMLRRPFGRAVKILRHFVPQRMTVWAIRLPHPVRHSPKEREENLVKNRNQARTVWFLLHYVTQASYDDNRSAYFLLNF